MDTQMITDLKKQREQLDGLILKLKGKDCLEKSDLAFYDETTKEIEKRLRGIRRFISGQVNVFNNEKQK